MSTPILQAVPTPTSAPAATPSQSAEIERVFKLQQARAISLRTSTYEERADKLKALLAALEAHTAEIHQAGWDDFRKPQPEMDFSEFMPVVAEIKFTLKNLKNWMKPQRVASTMAMMGTQGWLHYEPRGVCLIISPWNYPVNLTFGPLVSAIASGNTAMIKPSEMTPALSAVIGKIVASIFKEDEVAVFQGEVDVSQKLLEQPFDHIFFTGAPAIGKVVMAAAAKNLTSVTLELGGKSPTIIDSSADLKKAAQRVVWAKTANNGQTCIAPDYLFVHESVKEQFVAEVKLQLANVFGPTPEAQKNSPDYARIVNDRHFSRVNNLLNDAKAKGATVLAGGEIDAKQRFIQPTLIGRITDDMAIMEEEIFGPLLPIIGFTNIDHVIQQINAAPKPLALYIFSNNNELINKTIAQTSAGGTVVNHVVLQFAHKNLPFGGVNNSGIGSGHGHWGFKAFSHERSVIRDRFSIVHLAFPPYTPRVRMLIKVITKYLT